MKRHAAYQALKEGKKVTHKRFLKDEYLVYVNRTIVTEDGYKIENKFWADDDMFAEGFEIYNDERK